MYLSVESSAGAAAASADGADDRPVPKTPRGSRKRPGENFLEDHRRRAPQLFRRNKGISARPSSAIKADVAHVVTRRRRRVPVAARRRRPAPAPADAIEGSIGGPIEVDLPIEWLV